MSESGNKFLMSLPANLLKYIDDTVEVINLTKRVYSKKVNRQAVIRAIIEHCKEKNLQFSSTYTRYVWVKDEKISK